MMAGIAGDSAPSASARARYRVRQFQRAVWAALRPLQPEDEAIARAVLPDPAWALFLAMPEVDRRHGLAVLQTLHAAGYDDIALAQAALLHDCAKHQGGVTLVHRVVVVLLKAFRPETLRAWAAAPAPGPDGWRRAFWAHVHHPEIGAQLAAAAACEPEAIALIRRHQEPASPDAGARSDRLLMALQAADDEN